MKLIVIFLLTTVIFCAIMLMFLEYLVYKFKHESKVLYNIISTIQTIALWSSIITVIVLTCKYVMIIKQTI